MKKVYLISSLRNKEVPELAAFLRGEGFEVFDDWYAAGPDADDCWRNYHMVRGDSYLEALRMPAARHVFDFDKQWLEWADAAVLIAPAGKSAHLELGWMAGKGKETYVWMDTPERWDVMYQFCTGVVDNDHDLVQELLKARVSKERLV